MTRMGFELGFPGRKSVYESDALPTDNWSPIAFLQSRIFIFLYDNFALCTLLRVHTCNKKNNNNNNNNKKKTFSEISQFQHKREANEKRTIL